MSDDVDTPPRVTAPSRPVAVDNYVSPLIERLGTLAELTRGGFVGPDDGFGGAGDEGSL